MRRLWAAAAAVWLPVAATAGTGTWLSDLPDRIATHWNGSGAANGFSSATGFWVGTLIAGVLAGMVALVAAAVTASAFRSANDSAGGKTTDDPARDVRRVAAGRTSVIGAGAVAGAATGVWVATATAALADSTDPRPGWRFGYLAIGLAWGLAVWLIAGRAPRIDVPAQEPVDALALGPTERAAWSTTLRSLLRVTVDRRGLRLTTAVGGFAFKRIALDEITGAEVAEINPIEWGGWGYRVKPGSSALVLRGGPGLVLQLRDGRRFAVTLDDPRTPAALINGLRANSTN
ncbi:DUF1648 domain-containing protein [Actinoplanes sp. CA-015351]|uniref:DUF1648 domain-containing protein n=1 Tax=Actinoplanes sp. CA-015351 TaxID=3239897 RepID=UPI003D962FBC